MNKLLKKSPRSKTNPNTEYHEQTLHELNKLRYLHNSFSFTPPPSPCSVTTPDPLSRVASYSKAYSKPATPRLSSKQNSRSPWRTKKKPTSSTDSVFIHSPQHQNIQLLIDPYLQAELRFLRHPCIQDGRKNQEKVGRSG